MVATTVNTILPVPSEPLVDTETGVISRLWYQFFVALWKRTGSQGGTVSAVLDQIGDTQGGMLSRFATQWLEFVASSPNQVPVMSPGADINLLTVSQLLDLIGATRGSVFIRGAAGWVILPPGPAAEVITSQGPGNDPIYAPIPTPSMPTPPPATVSTGLTATGANQATAFPLFTDWSVVGTVAAGTGVGIPSRSPGLNIQIWNDGANALKVYPLVGGQVDALGVNNPYSLPSGKSQIIGRVANNLWRTQQLG